MYKVSQKNCDPVPERDQYFMELWAEDESTG